MGCAESSGGHLAEVVGVVVAAVVLFLAFGSLAASLLPIATALVGVGTAYASIVLLGHAMTVADFAPMLGMLIRLGVGIDYALFIVTRHRRGLKRGLAVAEAARNAVATTGRAVVFAGAAPYRPARHAHPAAQLPERCRDRGLLDRGPHRRGLRDPAARPAVPSSARAPSADVSGAGCTSTGAGDLPTGLAARWSVFVERHPKLLGAVAVVVMALLALPTLSLHFGTSDQGNNPRSATTRQAYDLLAKGFGRA